MIRAAALAIVSVLMSFGCSSTKDFEKLCHAAELSGAATVDPSEQRLFISRWVRESLGSATAATLDEMATVPPAEGGALLRAAAVKAGYKGPCPFADFDPK